MDEGINISKVAEKGFAGSAAAQPWGISAPSTMPESALPRVFDMELSGTTITLKNCAWQSGSQYFTSTDEPTVEAVSGIVCAIINKKTGGVTAEIDAEWDEAAPELIPLALYKISVSDGVVTVLLDRRGGTISLHE